MVNYKYILGSLNYYETTLKTIHLCVLFRARSKIYSISIVAVLKNTKDTVSKSMAYYVVFSPAGGAAGPGNRVPQYWVISGRTRLLSMNTFLEHKCSPWLNGELIPFVGRLEP